MQQLIQSFYLPNLPQQYVIDESMQDNMIPIVNDLIQIKDCVMRRSGIHKLSVKKIILVCALEYQA